MSIKRLKKLEGSNSGRIRTLKPILDEWTTCVSEITDEWKQKNDVPWWYNERASLSIFAGAIWRRGGFCFEEYSDKKRTVEGRNHRNRPLYHGRVDLHFSWHGHNFIAEAKKTYSGFSQSRNSARNRLTNWLEKACSDARLLQKKKQRSLGILFARPMFKKNIESKIDEKLDQWVQMLADINTDAYAWVFPECARHKWSSDGYFCPGEAVLIKEV